MYEKEKYLNTIEFSEVLELLAREATLSSAKDKAMALLPYDDFDTVALSLKQTEDAYLLTAKYAAPSFGSPKDPSGLLSRAEMGGVLGISELLDIADALRTIRVLKEWRSDISSGLSTSIDEFFECLLYNNTVK